MNSCEPGCANHSASQFVDQYWLVQIHHNSLSLLRQKVISPTINGKLFVSYYSLLREDPQGRNKCSNQDILLTNFLKRYVIFSLCRLSNDKKARHSYSAIWKLKKGEFVICFIDHLFRSVRYDVASWVHFITFICLLSNGFLCVPRKRSLVFWPEKSYYLFSGIFV